MVECAQILADFSGDHGFNVAHETTERDARTRRGAVEGPTQALPVREDVDGFEHARFALTLHAAP